MQTWPWTGNANWSEELVISEAVAIQFRCSSTVAVGLIWLQGTYKIVSCQSFKQNLWVPSLVPSGEDILLLNFHFLDS